jgi:hypothetical protein
MLPVIYPLSVVLFHDREELTTFSDIKVFAIMKCLALAPRW